MIKLRKQFCSLMRNDRGDISIFACFIITGVIMLISFLMLYASVKINCINIRNGAKMELNNLSAAIYADTYRSQRESNIREYLQTLYQSSSFTQGLEQSVEDGLAQKMPLETDDYLIKNIRLSFDVVDDHIEYEFRCDVEFYIYMFGSNYPVITQDIRLTGYHNTKF